MLMAGPIFYFFPQTCYVHPPLRSAVPGTSDKNGFLNPLISPVG